MKIIMMKNYLDDESGGNFRRTLSGVLDLDREILLDFAGTGTCDFLVLKEVFRMCRKCRERGAVIKVLNAPENIETILLLLNIMKENLVLV